MSTDNNQKVSMEETSTDLDPSRNSQTNFEPLAESPKKSNTEEKPRCSISPIANDRSDDNQSLNVTINQFRSCRSSLFDSSSSSSSDDDSETVDGGSETVDDESSEDSILFKYSDEDLEESRDDVDFHKPTSKFTIYEDEEESHALESFEPAKKSTSGKKVRFAPFAVTFMVLDTPEHEATRDGYWMQVARDNARFTKTIVEHACVLNRILHPLHREKILQERFLDGINQD